MTLANALTLVRLVLAGLSLTLMFLDFWLIGSIGILISVLLDMADGFIARRLDQVTLGGIYFDVLADKIVIISTYLVLGLKVHLAFFVLGLLMLMREYTVDTMRTVAATKHIVIPADTLSKIKGSLFMAAMIVAAFNQVLMFPYVTFGAIVLASVGMVFAYVTLVRFFFRYMSSLVS